MDYYKQPGISNSALGYLNPEQGGSPLKYKTFITEANKQEDDTISLENGKIVHKYIEDKSSFAISEVVRPSDMMAQWAERVFENIRHNPSIATLRDVNFENYFKYTEAVMHARGNAYQSIKDESKLKEKFKAEGSAYLDSLFEVSGKHVITSAQKKTIEGCIAGVERNARAQQLLFSESPNFMDELYSEKELYWEETINGVTLKCKGLVDKLRILHSEKKIIIMDFKTTGKHISLYRDTFVFRRTNRQLAFYERGVRKSIPDCEDYKVEFYVIAVETQGIHECRVFSISKQWIEDGREEYTKLLNEIAIRTKLNNWDIEEEELFYERS